MWAIKRECMNFGQMIETLSSGAGMTYLFPFAWEFSQLGTESPVALESFIPGKHRVWALWLPPLLREKAEKQRVIFTSL